MSEQNTTKAGERTQHTPGNWRYEWDREELEYKILGPKGEDGFSQIIGTIWPGNGEHIARLIAEAPETKAQRDGAVGMLRTLAYMFLSIDHDINRTPARLLLRDDVYNLIAECEKGGAQ